MPRGLLDPPARDELGHIDRDAAALLLDGYLHALSRHEAACRLALGNAATRFLETRGHRRLGFVRLADYARERLGLSGRELQCAAQVHTKVDSIAGLRSAFEDGRIGWSKLRMLASVATEEDAADWIAVAQSSTCPQLSAEIAAFKAGRRADGAAACPTPDVIGCDDDADQCDGEPSAELRLRCPARLRSLWTEVSELAARCCGGPLSQWQALEAITAEATSGVDFCARDEDQRTHSLADELRWSFGLRGTGRVPLRGSAPLRLSVDDTVDITGLRALVRSRLAGSDVDVLVARLNRGPDPTEMSPVELDRSMRATLRSMQSIDWQTGCLLATFARLKLHRNVGYESLAEYVRERLGISPRKARSLRRLEHDRSGGRAALSAAYRAGRLSWCRALLLLPVLSETHASAWIERADRVTVRRLADEVAWARDMVDRSSCWLEVAPPPLGSRLERSDEEARRQMCAGFGAERAERILRSGPTHHVVLRFQGPASVIALFYDVLQAYRRPGDGPAEAFMRVLLEVRRTWQALPRHRNPVHARDGWRCRVPACSVRKNLQEHHIVYRSRRGGNQRGNRASICFHHHQHLIHAGIVRANGDAESHIDWELGMGALGVGKPLLRTRDDVYVARG